MLKKFVFLIFVCFIYVNNVYTITTVPIDITNTNVREIQTYVDNDLLTYEELVRLYIERIEEYDKEFNSIITINYEAIEEAKKCDQYIKNNKRPSDLYCIPILVKDNVDVVGLPTSVGTKALMDSYPKNDSSVISNLKKAGAIVIAKTNMSEFAFSASNSKSSHGFVYNAFDTNYTSYGSSGGTSVSVKLSFGALGIGTDTNSSVRLPSSAANVIGMRPTYNLVNTSGVVNYDVTRDVVGPITKNVSDNALLLTYMTNNEVDYTNYLDKEGLKGKTIGVIKDFVYAQDSYISVLKNEDKDIIKLFEESIELMKEKGATIIYLDNFYETKYYEMYNKSIFGFTMCSQFNKYIKGTKSKIKSFQNLIDDGRFIQELEDYNEKCNVDYKNQDEYNAAINYNKKMLDYVYEVMDSNKIDVLVYPTNKTKILSSKSSLYGGAVSAAFTISPMTGMPSISVPMGFIDNLPYGIEFVAKKNREDILYQVSYSFEQLKNNYRNSNLANSLYDINDSVSKLSYNIINDRFRKISYSKSSYKNYNLVKEKVIMFLKDYNGDIKEADTLLKEYENVVNNLKPNYIFILYSLIISFIIVMFINYKFVKKRKKGK